MSFPTGEHSPDMPTSGEQRVAAIAILTVSIPGILLNSLAIFLVFRVTALRNSFGLLCVSHLVGDVGVLMVFACWAAPSALLNLDENFPTVSKRCGQLALLGWFSMLYAHIGISMNRLISLLMPGSYNKYFSRSSTEKIIIVIWILAVLHSLVYFVDGCDFVFNSESFMWEYTDSKCGRILSLVMDLIFGVTIGFLVLTIDIITITLLRRTNNRIKKSQGTAFEKSDQSKRFNAELRFFIQAFVSALVLCLMLVSFHLISPLFSSRWPRFILNTMAWQTAHLAHGITLYIFHREFRRVIKNPRIIFKSKAILNRTSSSPKVRKIYTTNAT